MLQILTRDNAGELESSDLKAYIESYLNEDRREKGKHLPRAAEGVNLGFSQEGSGCVIYIPSMKKTIVTNHSGSMRAIFLTVNHQLSMIMLENGSRINYERSRQHGKRMIKHCREVHMKMHTMILSPLI